MQWGWSVLINEELADDVDSLKRRDLLSESIEGTEGVTHYDGGVMLWCCRWQRNTLSFLLGCRGNFCRWREYVEQGEVAFKQSTLTSVCTAQVSSICESHVTVSKLSAIISSVLVPLT